jgi:hypothetical protein
VQANRPNVVVAAVTRLQGHEAAEARGGSSTRYVCLTALGDELFADLEVIGTLEKSGLASLDATPGIDATDDEGIRSFALRIGRRFGRFPFPDEVVPWLRPLQDTVEDKYDKPNSALGRALQEVVELRVEAPDWQAKPLELTLHVIVKAGTLPEVDEESEEDIPQQLSQWLRSAGDVIRTPVQIAERLYRRELRSGVAPTPGERYHLWNAFAEALANLCRPRGAEAGKPEVMQAVAEIVGMVSSDDEFNLSQYRRSEMLDLDYLSPPMPYAG